MVNEDFPGQAKFETCLSEEQARIQAFSRPEKESTLDLA